MSKLSIIKKSGEYVEFDPDKLHRSLIQSGASQVDADFVTSYVSNNIVDGMTSHKVYSIAYKLLKKRSTKIAGKYRLKKAIFDMGPTGYPFEHLVSELIKLQGYSTKTGTMIDGLCISHEVDVYATKHAETIFVECKFHNNARRKSDVRVSLYVKSRFLDLKSKFEKFSDVGHNFEGWIVTNTRFTTDATKFGTCAGLKMISWDYPAKGNLRQLIDESGFHPITTMHTITKKEKTYLLEQNVILCRHIANQTSLLKKMGIRESRILRIVNEANQISNIGN